MHEMKLKFKVDSRKLSHAG